MSKKDKIITRRGFLHSSGSFTLALPFLESLPMISSNAYAQEGRPKRFFFMINPHAPKGQHQPKGFGRDFGVPETHEPLAAYKDQMLLISNIDFKTAQRSGGNPHAKASANLLTGRTSNSTRGKGESVDQFISKAIDSPTATRSIEAGLANTGAAGHNFVVRGPTGNTLPFENDPGKIMDRLFKGFNPTASGGGEGGAPNKEAIEALQRKGNVLDLVIEDAKSLKNKLSANDKLRLDQHLESFFELEEELVREEASLNSGGPTSAGCAVPSGIGIDAANDIPSVTPLHFRVATMAFACDRTRVWTLSQDGARGATNHGFIPGFPNNRIHPVSHNDGTGKNLTIMRRWYAERIASFMEMLNETEDVDGSKLIDNTMFVWSAEIGSAADAHELNGHVFTFMGGKNMGLDLGKAVNGNKRSHNDILTTIIKAMGLPNRTFGEDGFNGGPIDDAFV